MKSRLVELYTTDSNSRGKFLLDFSTEEFLNLIKDLKICSGAVDELIPWYKSLEAEENKRQSALTTLWRKINRKAAEEAQEKYDQIKSTISRLENATVLYSYTKLLDIEIEKELKRFTHLSKNDVIVSAALTLSITLSQSIFPIIEETLEKLKKDAQIVEEIKSSLT